MTYAGELDTAVTALGGSAALLDVEDPGITTGRLDDACPVGGGVVSALGLAFSMTLSVVTPGECSRVAATVCDTSGSHCCGLS